MPTAAKQPFPRSLPHGCPSNQGARLAIAKEIMAVPERTLCAGFVHGTTY